MSESSNGTYWSSFEEASVLRSNGGRKVPIMETANKTLSNEAERHLSTEGLHREHSVYHYVPRNNPLVVSANEIAIEKSPEAGPLGRK